MPGLVLLDRYRGPWERLPGFFVLIASLLSSSSLRNSRILEVDEILVYVIQYIRK